MKGSRRVLHKLSEPISRAVAMVQGMMLAVIEVLKCWEASDVILFAYGAVFGAVQCSEGGFFVVREELGCCCVFWLDSLAVPTPWGIEHD